MMMNPTTPYVPGTYAKKRPEAGKVAAQYVQEWEARRQKLSQKKPASTEIPPCICFSRKVGVGAVEVADILARKLHMRVADREILEHMSGETRLDKETVKFYDELYPGKTVELSALLFGKKSFQMDDYLRNLVNAVYSIAAVGSTIFVGRGTHLILPRDRVLAVRLICSDNFRTERLASLLKIDAEEAGRDAHQNRPGAESLLQESLRQKGRAGLRVRPGRQLRPSRRTATGGGPGCTLLPEKILDRS